MIIDGADITKAIDDMADKLREADSTIKKRHIANPAKNLRK